MSTVRPSTVSLALLLLAGCDSGTAPADAGAPSASGLAAQPSGAISVAPSPSGAPSGSAEPAQTGSPSAVVTGTAAASAKASATPSATPSAKASAAPPATGSAAAPPPSTSPSAVVALPPPKPAEKGSADEVAEKIDGIFQPKKIIQAKFKQEFTIKAQGTTKSSSGVIIVEKPGKLSMRYDAPSKNRVVSDGKEIKVYVADDNVMYVSPVQGKEIPGAMSFMMGSGLRNNFDFTFNDKAKAVWTAGPVLWGKPRSATPHYDAVFFYVETALLDKKDPALMRRVLIVDTQGNKNRFDFSDVSAPASVDAKEFTFDPPKGTDIKRQ